MTGEITNADRRTISEELELLGEWNARSEAHLLRVEQERQRLTQKARSARAMSPKGFHTPAAKVGRLISDHFGTMAF